MTIPFVQAQNGKPKFQYFTLHPKFTSTTLSPRDLVDSKSEVTEAPEIPDKTFTDNPNFKYFNALGGTFKVSKAPKIPDKTFAENENGVHDVLAHHLESILAIHHLFRFSKGMVINSPFYCLLMHFYKHKDPNLSGILNSIKILKPSKMISILLISKFHNPL